MISEGNYVQLQHIYYGKKGGGGGKELINARIKINDNPVHEIAIHHDIPFHSHPNTESAMVAPCKFQLKQQFFCRSNACAQYQANVIQGMKASSVTSLIQQTSQCN
jgi:hypothetical protein